ncbi:hypothetical protein BDN70DRAFT_821062 [Pholiota conissans]|uniref:Uncharacterized protein n=1 Tax=Pholiota conissans TaxID=109636 RepID=A0A9P5YKW8_9AGAR|nr:hypothetical protein BDN70DRAFT_821062 [Pholiota conissans]
MSSSRGPLEDVYESQNDQQLDELHSKIRALGGGTPTQFPCRGMMLNSSTDDDRHTQRCGSAVLC